MKGAATILWTEELDAKIIGLWKRGKSASEIANALGEPHTRNGVIGRITRLRRWGVDVGRPLKLVNSKPPKPRSYTPRVRPQPSLAIVALKPLASVFKPPEPRPDRPGIVDLKRGECKFGHGDPGDSDFHFCGAKTSGGSWCDFHKSVVYQPLPAKVRKAAA